MVMDKKRRKTILKKTKNYNRDMLEASKELRDMENGKGEYETFTSMESLLKDLHK